MKNIIKMTLATLMLTPMLALGFGAVSPTTQTVSAESGSFIESVLNGLREVDPGGETDLMTLIRRVINGLLFCLGIISVLIIIYGGIRYTISGGDSNSVVAAKNTILYAVIGLVVAMMAYAIVNFVVSALA